MPHGAWHMGFRSPPPEESRRFANNQLRRGKRWIPYSKTRTYNPWVNRRPVASGVLLFSVEYAEPRGRFGALSALNLVKFLVKS